MPHIHTQPGDHDHTASAYIFRVDGPEPRILLHKHKKLDTLLQFGGHIEIQETPWQAISHEVPEESGYAMEQLRILQPKSRIKKLTEVTLHPMPVIEFTHAFNKMHNHSDRGYVFVTKEEPKHRIAADESQDIRLFTKAELLAVPPDEILPSVVEIAVYIFDNCLDSQAWEAIPTTEFES